MDDDIIDLTKYLGRASADGEPDGSRTSFSVWGGDGERSRFALPIWRSIYLVGGGRGGLVWVAEQGDSEPQALFVLDLAAEPARTDFTLPAVEGDDLGEAPTVLEEGDAVAVYLGGRSGKSWFLVLDDRSTNEPVTAGTREDLLFLAGECAGLLFFRELAEAGEELDLE